MKANLTALEIYYLVKELQVLISAKVDKIYHPQKKEILLQLHLPNKGKKILRIFVPSYMYLTDYKPEIERPSNFCMFLRKHLSNSRLRSIKQLGFERIVEFEFEKKEGKEKLIIELFSKGNIVLCDENNIILSPLETQTWKERVIKSNEKYLYPKKEFNFITLTEKEFSELLTQSSREFIVKTLAMDLGLGGTYAEEVLLISNIDKNKKPSEIKDKEIKTIFKTLTDIKKRKIQAELILKQDQTNLVKDIVPFNLDFYNKFEKKPAESYNAALDSHFTDVSLVEKEKTTKSQKELTKLSNIIDNQKAKIDEMRAKEQKNRQIGDTIYQSYAVIKTLLKTASEIVKKQGWEGLKTHFKGDKSVKKLNSKEKTITFKLP